LFIYFGLLNKPPRSEWGHFVIGVDCAVGPIMRAPSQVTIAPLGVLQILPAKEPDEEPPDVPCPRPLLESYYLHSIVNYTPKLPAG